jgi:hypothetical protein
MLRHFVKEINKLEGAVSMKKQFLKNMYRVKLSLYKFEQDYLRFQDMYNY